MKKPGFSLVVILTLALGIGANTAVFTVINSLLLRPLPYGSPDRIAYVFESRRSDITVEDSLSPHNFTDIRSRNRSFESCFAYNYEILTLTGNGQPEALVAGLVSADFGKTMGVPPAIGRLFEPAEDVPGKNRVVLLGDTLWKRRFSGDPKIAGSLIRLNGESFTVLGVMPPDFHFPSASTELWIPLALDLSKSQRGTSYLTMVSKIKPGVSLPGVREDMDQILAQLRKEYPENIGEDYRLKVKPFKEYLFGSLERPLMILFGSVTLVLLIACVNVANLMLGRATSRSKEIAVRSALGASRSRLIRLLLIEGLLLAVAGGAVGLLLASYSVQLLTLSQITAIPTGTQIQTDVRVIFFTFLVSILTGLLFALAPAWQTARFGVNQVLHENSRSATGNRRTKFFRAALVVVEISMSLVLLVGAGLLLKSLWKVLEIQPGFEVQNVVTSAITLPETKYSDPRQQAQFFKRTLDEVRALPGVESAGFATSMPFSGSRGTSSFSIDGRDSSVNNGPQADRHQVSPGYFRAMRIPIKAGRDFTDQDNFSTQQVIIINEIAAKKFWPGESPIGKHVTIGMPNEVALYGKEPSREIVGIVGNVKHENLKDDFAPEMYIPAWQLPSAGMTLVVHGQGSAESILGNVRRVVQTIDPDQPVRSVKVLQDSLARSVAPEKFLATLLLLFAGLALALALIGIYAVMSYSVEQRIPEIGVRMALGATPGEALQPIIKQGVVLALLGMGAGFAAALALTRVMQGLLFEVSPTDPATILLMSTVLLIVTLAACLIPARRATRVDPIVALRYE